MAGETPVQVAAHVETFMDSVTAAAARSAIGAGTLSSTDIDTLAELNAIIGDATLIDTADSRLSDARTPTTHASTHTNGTDDIQDATAAQKGLMTAAYASKLDGIEADAEANNISDANATDLTDGGDSTLHYHASDRARANHTGTQLLSTISDAGTAAALNVAATGDAAAGEVVKGNDSRLTDARTPMSHTHTASEVTDFDTEVANNSAVAANTAKVTNATHTGDATGDGALSVVALRGVGLDSTVGTPSDGDIMVYRSAGTDWVLEAKPAGGSNPAINDVTDITITTPADNEVLAYDNGTGEWINQTAAEAGLAEASHTHALTNLSDVSTLLPDNLEVLAYNSGAGEWTNYTIAEVGAAAASHNHAASEITSGTLAHERGGLEADVSAYSGFVKITGGATSAVSPTGADAAVVTGTAGTANTLAQWNADGDIVGAPQQLLFAAAFSDETNAITTGQKFATDVPANLVITRVYLSCATAPTTSALVVDVEDEGTSILNAALSMTAATNNVETSSFTGATSSYAMTKGDLLTIDVDTADSGGTAAGAKIYIFGYLT